MVKEGEFKGQLRVKISKSPLISYSIIVNPKNSRSVCAVGADDVGEEDAESNILAFDEYIDEASGKVHRDGCFSLPADAYRDKTTMEWIMAAKESASETDAAFSDLIFSRHEEIAQSGGLTGLRAFEAKQTGFANVTDEASIEHQLESNPEQSDAILAAMAESYGKEELERMKPAEFYRLYRNYSLGKQ